MKSLCAFILACLSWTGFPESSAGAPGDGDLLPEWIWPNGDRGKGKDKDSDVTFQKEFSVDGEIDTARLRVTADFARLAVVIGGKPVAEVEAYDPPLDLDIRPFLVQGHNRIRIIATSVSGPSAVAAAMTIRLKNGRNVTHLTDPGWLFETGLPNVGLGRIHPHRWAPNRLPDISPFAEYNQWKEATAGAGEQLSPLPPGFEIEKIYTAKEGEDSWVSMAIDSEGRIIIAKEQRGLLRLTMPAEKGAGIRSEVINDTLDECRGLAWKNGVLFANANRSNGLYRLRDSNEDGQFDEVTLLRRTEGSTGHGRNDLALGPDGNIHAIHGDSVIVPGDARLRTVPELGAQKELGHWVSTTPGGNGWEIHSRGLRNPFGIAFNPDGEPFTYDADNEGDVGLPFYRPTRINHLVSGANYGWHQDRGNTRNLTVYAPDSVPTTFDVGRGSPTAVKFGTRSHFPKVYRDALFALDWAYGRIIAVHLTPRGASYYGSGEVFLEGRPLNVTDLDFDADGAMYFVTGGRKTQSALYRIRYDGETGKGGPVSAQAMARNSFSSEARVRRRQIERYHGNPDPPDFEIAWKTLGDPDPWIRNAARVAVETQNLERWRMRALGARGDLHGLTALLALVRQGTDDDRMAVIEKASKFDTTHWNRSEKLSLLRLYEISEIDFQSVDFQLIENIWNQLEPFLKDQAAPIQQEVIRILVSVHSPMAVSAGILFLAAAEDQLERLHYLEMLSEARIGWTEDLRNAYFQLLVHASQFSYGDRFMEAFFQTLEKNALAAIESEETRDHFAAFLSDSSPDLPELKEPSPRKAVKTWAVADFSDAFDGSLGDRDPEQGRKMFDAALCSRCHVAGIHGRPVGPDLTTIASRFSRRDLLEAIIEPSKVVAEVHRNVVIKKKDGSLLQGRIIQNDFRKSLLYLSTNPFLPGDLTEIQKSEIESFEDSLISPMPPALLNTLTKEEILDLLAWLEAGGAQ